MFFADFETTTAKQNKNKSSVWLWGIKGAQLGDKLNYGVDLHSFFETIHEKKMTTVYFHNLSFDGNYIFKWLFDNDYKDFNFVNINNIGYDDELQENEFKWICDERGGIYKLWVNYKGTLISFLDSWKVLMASVAKLGETIKMNKKEIDYDEYGVYKNKDDVPLIAIEYLERDIDVVIETFSRAILLYKKKMTRASMAYEDFMTYYNENSTNGRQFSLDFGGQLWDYKKKEFYWNNVLSKKQWLVVQKSYQGGYVNWNQNITNKTIKTKKGNSVDVNSLFPSVMKNKKIPYGRMLYTKPLTDDYVCLKTILIQSAVIKDKKFSALIKKHGGKYAESKYLDNVKYKEYTFWEEELDFIEKQYEMHYVVLKTMYFRTKWVFKDWLEVKKELKINAANQLDRDFHKGIQNSVYGKFAQNIKIGSRIFVQDGNHVKTVDGERFLVDVKTGEVVKKMQVNSLRYGKKGQWKHEAEFVESDKYKHIAVASYITSQARLILWKAIYNNLDIWLYSDTDSCYFTDIPKGIEIHESKYGAWKAEYKFTKFKVIRAKAYIFQASHAWKKSKWVKHNKIVKKISGMSANGKEKINFENFYIGSIIKEGKRSVKNVDGGKLIYDTDFKLGREVFI